jgi:hypothetical protein
MVCLYYDLSKLDLSKFTCDDEVVDHGAHDNSIGCGDCHVGMAS